METLPPVAKRPELFELADLSRILLNLARSREFPEGSSRHGYDFIPPLDAEGTSMRAFLTKISGLLSRAAILAGRRG
jgi:hypothetical protein